MMPKYMYIWLGTAIFFLFSVGTAFYVLHEGWSFLDAVYMVILTATTIGYGEAGDLTDGGKVFTIFLMLLSWGVATSFVGLVTYGLVSIRFDTMLQRRRMEKRIEKLANHYIICGAGQVGRHVMQEFEKTLEPYVVIEHNKEKVEALLDEFPNIYIIEGDSTENHVLEKANIEHAKGVLCALDSDSSNLFLCLTARDLNPRLRIVSRANEAESIHKLEKAGADTVVSPTIIGALRMASTAIRPAVVNFLDIMIRKQDVTLRMEEVDVPKGSPLSGKNLIEAQIPSKTDLMVIAIQQASSGKFIFNPTGTFVINEGDALIILGTPDQKAKLIDLAKA